MDFPDETVVFGGPKIAPQNGSWRLTDPYYVLYGQSYRFYCPSGMWTDGASIPRFFWRVIGHPMQLPCVKAAVVHDAGYMGKLEWCHLEDGEWVAEEHTRKEIDQLFMALMKALGISWWRRRMMYLAVRWFGGSHWTKR